MTSRFFMYPNPGRRRRGEPHLATLKAFLRAVALHKLADNWWVGGTWERGEIAGENGFFTTEAQRTQRTVTEDSIFYS
jgi:hypothetical protein